MIDLCKFFDLANEGKNNYYFYGDLNRKYANSNINNEFKRNRIIFGAPGTGKSFKLNNEKDQLVQSDEQYERVTFHLDYTYANFVGTYKPVMVESDNSFNLSENDRKIIDILKTPHLNAQDKYDRIDEMKIIDTKGELNYLVSLCTEEGDDFQQKKEDGTYQSRTVETIVCRKIKKYFQLIDESSNDSIISYEYVPGPFMRLFVKAKKNPNIPYLLLIEEINRANVAAVFGDLFQLLDRDDNEESMYPVEASEDIKKFLLKEGIKLDNNKLIIPNNLFIWATMNSADQGVFPMDTAFKRRWNFEYIGIDKEEEKIKNRIIELDVVNGKQYINWNRLRKAINDCIAANKINEDKQLGPFFVSKKVLGNMYDESNKDETIVKGKDFEETFKDKVLMYLFEDVFKSRSSKIFVDLYNGIFRYSNICTKLNEVGLKIFNIDSIDSVYTTDVEKINEILD